MRERRRPSVTNRATRSRKPDRSSLAIIGLVLGIIALVAWLIPAIGLFIALVGLTIIYLSRDSSSEKIVRIGFILNGLGLLGSLANAVLGSYLGLTGFF